MRLAALAFVVLVAAGAWLALRGPEPVAPVADHGFAVPAVEGEAEVWAFGDGADGSEASRAVARMVASADPDAVVYLGDVYDHGTAAEFEANVREPYGPFLDRMLPTPGNHEWPLREVGYDPFWADVTGAPAPPWYALRVGGWQLLSLNSEAEHDDGSPQLGWLRERLLEPATCRLAFWHRPRHTTGVHGDQRDVAPLWDAVAGRAALVLNGHEHSHERFEPRDGTVQVVNGTGGAALRELGEPRDELAFGDDEHHGAVRLTLGDGEAGIEFVAVGGDVLDRSRVEC